MRLRPFVFLLAFTGFAISAQAHEREYTLSRDWFLPYQGEHEVEWRSFFDTTHGQYDAQFEYEYGVTEWFAIEPGLEVHEKEEGNLEVEGAELELRFHWGKFDYDKWLPALNVEYEQPFEDEPGEEPAIELKTVLSRYGESGHDFTVNLNFGKQISGEKESEGELTAGWVMPLDANANDSAGWHHGARAGIEGIDDFRHGNARVGPLFVYRPSNHLNLLTSYAVAVDERDEGNFDELTVIVEWEF